MPAFERFKTKYPGVYYIETFPAAKKRPERIYYILYRRDGKLIEEKAGRQFKDDMSAARAAAVRTLRIQGNQPSNKQKREAERQKELSEENRPTIHRLWKLYKEQNPNLKGIAQDENRFKKYLAPVFGEKEPSDLIPLDVDRIRLKMLKDKSPQTVKLTLALLRRVINFGARKGLCEPLPFTIEMPKVNNLKTEDLSQEQIQSLLQAIDEDTHDQAGSAMKMALFTGMRRGEIFKLKWEHIDFERGFISIVDPKGGIDQKIPLNEIARTLLKSYPRAASPYVFPGRTGNQRVDINKHVNRIKQEAGLPKDFRPLHGLRHVYASMLASSGRVDMYTLQKLLTHKSSVMTQRYAHLRDEALKKASDVAGDLLGEIMHVRNKKQEDQTG